MSASAATTGDQIATASTAREVATRTWHWERTKTRKAAAADEQAARARREAAEAEERSRAAERQQETAQAHEQHATEIDPDAGVTATVETLPTQSLDGRAPDLRARQPHTREF